jgi:hypothetical protein
MTAALQTALGILCIVLPILHVLSVPRAGTGRAAASL